MNKMSMDHEKMDGVGRKKGGLREDVTEIASSLTQYSLSPLKTGFHWAHDHLNWIKSVFPDSLETLCGQWDISRNVVSYILHISLKRSLMCALASSYPLPPSYCLEYWHNSWHLLLVPEEEPHSGNGRAESWKKLESLDNYTITTPALIATPHTLHMRKKLQFCLSHC